MIRNSLITILLLAASDISATAQDTLIAVQEGKLWGYKNQDSVLVIKHKYQQVNSFHEGFACVKSNNRWGIVDVKGKEITPFKYDCMWDGDRDFADYYFSEGLAAVCSNGKHGFINKTGTEVIPLTYSYAHSFRKGSAEVKKGDRTLLINKAGQNLLIKPYDMVYFTGDRAEVSLNGKCGFIDRAGKEVVPLKYDATNWYEEGYAVVRKGDKATFIDMKGKEMIPFIYGSMHSFSDGLAMARKPGEPWGFINYKGEVVIPFEYESGHSFESGAALMRKGGVWGLIDTTGKPLTEFKYEDEGVTIVLGPRFTEGLVALMYKGKYGYVDVATGKEITPFKYDRAWPFYGCCAKVAINEKWGEVDKTGKEDWTKKLED